MGTGEAFKPLCVCGYRIHFSKRKMTETTTLDSICTICHEFVRVRFVEMIYLVWFGLPNGTQPERKLVSPLLLGRRRDLHEFDDVDDVRCLLLHIKTPYNIHVIVLIMLLNVHPIIRPLASFRDSVQIPHSQFQFNLVSEWKRVFTKNFRPVLHSLLIHSLYTRVCLGVIRKHGN